MRAGRFHADQVIGSALALVPECASVFAVGPAPLIAAWLTATPGYTQPAQRSSLTPAPIAARPTILIGNHKTLRVDGTTIELRYYGPAHTDGDLSVYLPAADILQTGDNWWNGSYPMIDYGAGDFVHTSRVSRVVTIAPRSGTRWPT